MEAEQGRLFKRFDGNIYLFIFLVNSCFKSEFGRTHTSTNKGAGGTCSSQTHQQQRCRMEISCLGPPACRAAELFCSSLPMEKSPRKWNTCPPCRRFLPHLRWAFPSDRQAAFQQPLACCGLIKMRNSSRAADQRKQCDPLHRPLPSLLLWHRCRADLLGPLPKPHDNACPLGGRWTYRPQFLQCCLRSDAKSRR